MKFTRLDASWPLPASQTSFPSTVPIPLFLWIWAWPSSEWAKLFMPLNSALLSLTFSFLDKGLQVIQILPLWEVFLTSLCCAECLSLWLVCLLYSTQLIPRLPAYLLPRLWACHSFILPLIHPPNILTSKYTRHWGYSSNQSCHRSLPSWYTISWKEIEIK